jgi:hypothetical protein
MKYKLLKELPGRKAGDIVDVPDTALTVQWFGVGGINITVDPRDPDWFAPLPDEPQRWRAEDGELYWFLSFNLSPQGSVDCSVGTDNSLYKLGNYFRTREQAETMAEAIKAVLGYVHTPYGEPTLTLGKGYIDNRIEEARKLIQEDN